MASTIQEFIWDINIPFDETVGFNTLITKYEDGKEQRRQKWSRPKRNFDISLRGRTNVIMQQAWDFYIARNGSFDTFYFENPNESPVSSEILGTGNGINVNFNLAHYPLPSGAITLTSGATTFTETSHYTLTRSTGAVVFNVAPTGDVVATNYNFCRVVRFAEDNLDRELFNYRLFNTKLKLIEVLS